MNMRQERENRNKSRILKKASWNFCSGKRYRFSLSNYNKDKIELKIRKNRKRDKNEERKYKQQIRGGHTNWFH